MPNSTLARLPTYEPGQPDAVDDGKGLVPHLSPRDTQTGEAGKPSLELRQVRAVLNLILEVRAGHRPPGQLRALVHPRLFRLLSEQQTTWVRHTLKTVHVCRVAPNAVEACGTAHSQGRAYAVAARFEVGPQGWRCTFFELIRPSRTQRR